MLAMTYWGQEIGWGDLGIVGLLVVLEGVLSIDNALVLGLLAKRLPPKQRPKALTYGLVGAFAFRFVAIAIATKLLEWRWVKLVGGGYLAYVAVRHLVFESREEHQEHVTRSATGEPQLVDIHGAPLSGPEAEEELRQRLLMSGRDLHVKTSARRAARFWPTVAVIELTDIAFAVDSIVAAIGVVGSPPTSVPADAVHPKLWVIITGGLLGVILMRFAAVVFIRLLERFPRFETAAYLLVAVIGAKLLADWVLNSAEHPHRVNFHDPGNAAFWIFWTAMFASFLTGFLPNRESSTTAIEPGPPDA